MYPGALFFSFRHESDGIVMYERPFEPWGAVILIFIFIVLAVYFQKPSYIFAITIIFGLDVLLEVASVYFFKQDIKRKGKPVLESGSFWKGNKQYKGDI
jgi:ABC-type microcin C transport system permease subunit YejE